MSDIRIAVRPTGEERHRLVAETGLVCWHYRSVPVADEIEGVAVWCFQWTAIEEPKMQDYLLRRWMKAYRLGRTKALEMLVHERICIPQDRIEIEETGL